MVFGDEEIQSGGLSQDSPNGTFGTNLIDVVIGRVRDVNLDEEDFTTHGRIEILVANGSEAEDSGKYEKRYAYPVNIYNYTLPTINESVVCFLLEDKKYYYMSIPPVNLVSPSTLEMLEKNDEYEELPEENVKVNFNNYEEFEVNDDAEELVYGTNMTPELIEATDVVSARKVHEGDTVLQGRYGQSIKFTCRNELNETPWSLDGEDGQPVIAIRCGQEQLEDPTTDNSFIYLLSDQSFDFGDIEFSPESANLGDTMDAYVGSQVIIGADRLTFLSKSDDISISSKSLVSISTSKWAVDVDVLMDQVKALAEQLDALCTGKATLTTGVGPTGPGTNAADTTAIVQEISGMEQ